MATVKALADKVKFQNTGKTEYRVETVLSGAKCNWKTTFDSYEEAMEYIENEKANDSGFCDDRRFLVTEIYTRTMGLF